MIAAYVGSPGDCKTYSMTHWLLQEMRHHRLGVSQYAVNGAERLEQLGDLLHPHFQGASVAIDEVGRILPAREWSNEDEIETALLETHRHHGLEIRYCCQDLGQVSVSLRRLTEWYIFCFRVGPDPSRILQLGGKPGWWQCPFAVRHVYVHSRDLGSDGRPKAVEKTVEGKTKYIWWRKSVADSYDTTERIYPGHLDKLIKSHLAEASERISPDKMEPWVVHNGQATGGTTLLTRMRDSQKERKAALKALEKKDGKGTNAGGTDLLIP